MFYCHPRQKVHCRGWHLAAKTAITTLGVLSESVSRGWHLTPKSAITAHGGIFPWVAPNAKIRHYHSRFFFCDRLWVAPSAKIGYYHSRDTHAHNMIIDCFDHALTTVLALFGRLVAIALVVLFSNFYCGKLYFILFIYIYGSLCIRFYHFIECLFKCDGVWRMESRQMESTYVVFGLFVCRI